MTNPHFPHFPIDIFIRLWYNIGVANEKEMKKMLMLKMIVLLALAMVFALAACGAEFVRDVEPGEIVVVDEDGVHSIRSCIPEKPKKSLCVFEYIYYNDGAAKWVSSNRMSKDDMVSLLFDLSLLGYYVNLVRTVKFSFEYSIQMYLHPSGNMRTNIGSSTIEQISKMIDQANCG